MTPAVPGPWRRVRYALGGRLPADYRDWVWCDLTDTGWRTRLLARYVTGLTPIGLVAAVLPGEWWIRFMMAVMVLVGSLFTVAVSAAELRCSRLRRHGIDPALLLLREWSGR
jgi:hypothetical protein